MWCRGPLFYPPVDKRGERENFFRGASKKENLGKSRVSNGLLGENRRADPQWERTALFLHKKFRFLKATPWELEPPLGRVISNKRPGNIKELGPLRAIRRDPPKEGHNSCQDPP